MGNELTRDADFVRLEKYLEGNRLSSEEIKRHGWDKHNMSPSLDLLSDGITCKKSDKPGQKDIALGKVGYTQGVHMYEFKWTPGTKKHVSIGIAAENITVHADTGEHLLGCDDQSIAWDLLNHNIIFNGCVIKQLPMFSSNDSPLNERLIMVLDMDQGILSFKAGAKYEVLDMDQGILSFKAGAKYEVAMRGLKHANDTFYVAACVDKPNDQVTMKYLGSSDLDDKEAESTPLRFHDKCGKNIVLSENNAIATRNLPRDNFNHATVFTNRPLNDGEMFTVSIMNVDDTKWSGGVTLGVSTVSPVEINFFDWMPACKTGKTCLYKDNKILEQDVETPTNTNIDRLKEGGTVGVRRMGTAVEFFVNGEKETSYKTSIGKSDQVYGCADVYGQVVSVKLISRDMRSKKGDPNLKGQIIETGKPVQRRRFLGAIEETLKLMKVMGVETVDRVCRAVENNLIYPFKKVTDTHLKETVAEQMARKETDAADIFRKYILFLKRVDMASVNMSIQCYDVILEACRLYAKCSLNLCRQFGSTGLLEVLIKDLDEMKSSWSKTSSKQSRSNKLFGIISTCSEQDENKPIFKGLNFAHIAKHYMSNDAIGIDALFTLANIYKDPGEAAVLEASEQLCKKLVEMLNSAVETKLKQQGYTITQLGKCLNDLAACATNIPRFVKMDVMKPLMKMLQADESLTMDQPTRESALNAIWSLLTADTYSQIRTDPLMTLLRDLEVDHNAEVKQAAKRVLIKIEKLSKPKLHTVDSSAKISARCPYAKICREFKTSLNLSEAYFQDGFDTCYCETCHGNRGDRGYYTRGNPPKDYGLPIGWFRFALITPARVAAEKMFEDWHRAYHGTKKEFLADIFKAGELCPPGRKVVGGKMVKELPGHFDDKRKPEGFDTKQVFLSPSIRYSGVDTYAVPSKFISKDTKKTYNAKVALQVLACPGEYKTGPETIGAFKELDPGFKNQELEWMTNIQGSTVFYGLLVNLV